MDEEIIPKLMHDANARRHRKLRILLRSLGAEGYGKYWIVMERLREEKENRLDSTELGFWSDMADELKCSEADSQEFFKELSERFCLLGYDGRFYYSDRILSDVSRFKEKRSAQSSGGKIGAANRWGTHILPIGKLEEPNNLPNGVLVGEYLILSLSLNSNSDLSKDQKKEIVDRARAKYGINPQVLQHGKALIQEFTREGFTHYVKLCSAHAKARDKNPVDFLAWVEEWMRKDKAEGKGFFKQPWQTQKRADRQIFKG